MSLPRFTWQENNAQQLITVLAAIDSAEQMQKFLEDVLTKNEIIEMSARLEAARLLRNKTTYKEVERATKLSSRTIARINKWLKTGTGGYDTALNTLNNISHT